MSFQSREYDVALSFADEDRIHAKTLAELLQSANVKVFYDSFEQSSLWGEDLYTYLADIYGKKAKYCVMFLSANYKSKLWTSHERKFAQERAFIENRAYILPIKLDDTEIPGIPTTISYLDLRVTPIDEVFRLLIKKLQSFKAEEVDSYKNPFTIDEQLVKKYVTKYKEKVKANPSDGKAVYTLGLFYLRLKLYDFALTNFKKAIDLMPEEADPYYYYALTLVKGKRPKILNHKDVNQIEEFLNTAIQLDDKANFYYLAAIINYDYYAANGLRIPTPNYNELIKNAKTAKSDPDEIKILLDNIILRDEKLISIIRSDAY